MDQGAAELGHLTELFLAAVEAAGQKTSGEDAGGGLSPLQYQALRFFRGNRRSCLGDLAAALRVSKPAATQLVNRMERAGLVRRVSLKGEDGRRLTGVRILPPGSRRLGETQAQRDATWARVAAAMGPEAAAALRRGMKGFVRAVLATEDLMEEDVCRCCGNRHYAGCPLEEAFSARLAGASVVTGEGGWTGGAGGDETETRGGNG